MRNRQRVADRKRHKKKSITQNEEKERIKKRGEQDKIVHGNAMKYQHVIPQHTKMNFVYA